MSDRAALELLTKLAALQRRNSGGIILLAANRSGAWADTEPDVKVPVDPTVLRELVAQELVMVEPYAETKPRGLQLLGMTSKGWRLAARPGLRAARHPAA